jgi:hypothetical protein
VVPIPATLIETDIPKNEMLKKGGGPENLVLTKKKITRQIYKKKYEMTNK